MLLYFNLMMIISMIIFCKDVNTLKEAINLRDEWMKHFSSYYQKFMEYITYTIFVDNDNYIGIGIEKKDNKYTVMFINTYR